MVRKKETEEETPSFRLPLHADEFTEIKSEKTETFRGDCFFLYFAAFTGNIRFFIIFQ